MKDGQFRQLHMQYGWNPERRKNDICKSVCSRRNYLHISTDLFGSYKVNAGKSDGVTRNNRGNPWSGRHLLNGQDVEQVFHCPDLDITCPKV